MLVGIWRRSIRSSRRREQAVFLRRHGMTPQTPRPMRSRQSGNKSSPGASGSGDSKGGSLEFVEVMREMARRARVEAVELSELVKSFVIELPVIVPRAFIFVGLLNVVPEYGFKTVTCEGPSMEPTIIDGSYTCVLVERFSHRIYGLWGDDDRPASLDDGELATAAKERCREAVDDDPMQLLIGQYKTLMKGVWDQHFRSGLQRGDVVIAHHPLKCSTICKRIVALPGDVIQRTDGGSRETGHRVEVPKGHIWIEGDNSCASLDSRQYGCVPASLVIGKVVCRLWPLRDYVSLGLDGNGQEHWRYVSARVGRGGRPLDARTGREQSNGSFVVN